MKILHVLDHSVPMQSGYTIRTAFLSHAQRALGWETDHLTGPKHTAMSEDEETAHGLHFWRTPPARTLLGRAPVLRQWDVVRRLRRRLREILPVVRPDLLHVHSPVLNGLAALPVARAAGIPLVYEVRAFWEDAAADQGTSPEGGLRYRTTRNLESRVLRGADAVTTICEGLKRDIVDRGIPADKVTVVPNGVDIEQLPVAWGRDRDLEVRHDLEGKTVLGFIGSFFAYEGLHLLVDAVHALRERHPELRLLLVGGGEEAERIDEHVDAIGVGELVIRPGRVPYDEVDRYYSVCDVMVYPRLSMRLTELVTPLKPLEAMAREKPVLASDVGGHRDLIRNGETGRMFASGSVESLADAIGDMLDSRESWPALESAGRAFVTTERTWKATAERYVPVFERLSGTHAAVTGAPDA